MSTCYFDCFSGVSGDMILGALVDAGADLAVVEAAVEALGLSSEVRVSARHEQRGHLGGTRVLVETGEGPPRRVPQLLDAIAGAGLPERVRDRSLGTVRRLAAAEAAIHGEAEAELHLHELGGADTLVDVVGAFSLLDSLGVEAVHAGPLPAPRGWIRPDLPLPGPAAMRVLAGTGAVLEPDNRGVELVTPTGAAILAEVAAFTRPAMSLDSIGYGIGGRDLPGNALAAWLGRPVAEAASVDVLETNLDDMTPAQLADVVDDLLARGALDVTVTPLLMKKGRPGHALSVMCEPPARAGLAARLLERTTALGLRVSHRDRILAGRRIITVSTAGGDVRVKVKEIGGRGVEYHAEHDDCARAAAATGADPRAVALEAETAARRGTDA